MDIVLIIAIMGGLYMLTQTAPQAMQAIEDLGAEFTDEMGPDYMPTMDGDTMPDQVPSLFDATISEAVSAAQNLGQSAGFTTAPSATTTAQNRAAFLDMLAYSEGTAGPNGYRTLFGGTLFTDTRDHPRQFFTFTNSIGKTLRTSAAGRYQFLSRTWDELRAKLDLPDFGAASQDAAALELCRQRGALADIDAGRIEAAIKKCAPTWASLPGAGYNQPERKLSSLIATYRQTGGNLTA